MSSAMGRLCAKTHTGSSLKASRNNRRGAPMPSRREVLIGGAAMTVLPGSLLAKASQPATRVNFELPANACDCHTHIHGDTKEFPMISGHVYTPEPPMPEEMPQLSKT